MLLVCADFVYTGRDCYYPTTEVPLAWADAAVGMGWPRDAGGEPQLSAKDTQALSWDELPLFD